MKVRKIMWKAECNAIQWTHFGHPQPIIFCYFDSKSLENGIMRALYIHQIQDTWIKLRVGGYLQWILQESIHRHRTSTPSQYIIFF